LRICRCNLKAVWIFCNYGSRYLLDDYHAISTQGKILQTTIYRDYLKYSTIVDLIINSQIPAIYYSDKIFMPVFNYAIDIYIYNLPHKMDCTIGIS
jgi:hypothetical protein